MKIPMKKRILLLALPLILSCNLLSISAEAALSPRDNYYLTNLSPKLPKNAESYPAKLLVSYSGNTVTLNGTCGMDASLTKEEMADILKKAASAVPSYHDPEGAITDQAAVKKLTDKLDISDKAGEELFNNFLKVMGYDDILGKFNPISVPDFDGLNGNVFHDYETAKGYVEFGKKIKEIYEILAGTGDLVGFLKPDMLPSIQSIAYNSAKITWEQFQKDQEKYSDIVKLSQAKARLRLYYNHVNELIRRLQSEKGIWAIRIHDQQTINTVYNPLYGKTVPCTFTADMELKKLDGKDTNIAGSYTGSFTLQEYTDLSEYDSLRAVLHAEYMNQNLGMTIAGQAVGQLPYEAKSIRINSPSQSYATLAGNDISVNLALPYGKNRAFFELPLNTMDLEQTEFVNTCDFVATIVAENKVSRSTISVTEIYETSSYYRDDYALIESLIAPFTSSDGHSSESGALLTDIRPYLQMKLIVDMLD